MKGSPESGSEKPTCLIGIHSVPNPSHTVNIPGRGVCLLLFLDTNSLAFGSLVGAVGQPLTAFGRPAGLLADL